MKNTQISAELLFLVSRSSNFQFFSGLPYALEIQILDLNLELLNLLLV